MSATIEARINGLEITEFDFSQLENGPRNLIKKQWLSLSQTKLTEIIGKLPQELKTQFTIVQSAPFFLEFLKPKFKQRCGYWSNR